MPSKITPEQRAYARVLYEERGYSLRNVAEALNVTATTISNWKKQEGWVKPSPEEIEENITTPEDGFDPDALQEAFAPGQRAPAADHLDVNKEELIARLQAELLDTQHKLKEAEGEAEAYRPEKEFHIYETPSEVVEFLGEKRLEEMVLDRFANMNIERMKRGYPAVDPTSAAPERVKAERDAILEDLLERRTKWVRPEYVVRTVKMLHSNGKTLVQIPSESHINNEAGAKGAGILKYRDKGFRLLTPYLCQRYECWLPAKQDPETGKLTLYGYCSVPHMETDPYLKDKVPGVTTSEMMGGIAR